MNKDKELKMRASIADVANEPLDEPKVYGVANALFPTVDDKTRDLNFMYHEIVRGLMRVTNQLAPMIAQQLNLNEREGKGALVVALEQMLAATASSSLNLSSMRHESLNNELNQVLKRYSRDEIVLPKKQLVVPDVDTQTPLQPGPPT
jgi:hypothetical protein